MGNIQTYQLQMVDSGEVGGKLPNANCDYQTTKWKYPNLPTTNDRFWGWGRGVNYQTQIVTSFLSLTCEICSRNYTVKSVVKL